MQVNYAAGKRQGRYQKLYADGKPEVIGKYTHGLKDSVWTEYSPKQGIKWQGTFVAGQAVGTHRAFDDEGNLEEEVRYRPGTDVAYVRRYLPGNKLWKEGKLVGGAPDSTWATDRADGGPLQQEQFQEGRLVLATEATLGGKALAGSAFPTPAGTARSLYNAFGQKVEEGFYRDGLRDGSWKEFSEKGRLEAEGTYQAGYKEGTWVLYDEKGRRAQMGRFEANEPVGIWEVYDKKGRITGTRAVED